MNVTLYTFSKKHNSTAVPSAAGTSVDVVLKDEAGVLDPVIELHDSASPASYNYMYIPTFGRYYWLREWNYYRGIWIGSFYVDPLASWRTQIGAQSLYVFRSAYEFNGRIIDNLYPITADPEFKVTEIPGFWTSTQASSSAGHGTGLYVLGIIGDGNIDYYGFQKPDLDSFLTALFDDSYYQTLVGAGAVLSPEIKAEVNPLQYVASVRYYPSGFSAAANHWGELRFSSGGSPTAIKVGKGTVTLTGVTVYYFTSVNSIVGAYPYQITIGASSFDHPQQSRGKFLRGAPFTSWELYMPPYGLIELDANELIDTMYLGLRIIADIRTGSSVLEVAAIEADNTTHLLAKVGGMIGIDCPLTNVMQTGINYISVGRSALGAAFNAMAGNVPGVIGSLHDALGSATQGRIPHLSTVGSQGSGAETGGTPRLVTTYYKVTDDDVAGRGRPLCGKRTISAIPGYITADPDELNIAATAREQEEIRGYISGGFFYE